MECLVYGLWVRDFLKILFLHKFRLNSNDRFLAKAIFLLKISSKDLPMVCFVVTQHSESELSLCLHYSKTSCRRQLKKSTEHTDNTEKDFCLLFYLKLATLIYPRVNCPYVIFEVLFIFVQ